MLGQVGEHVGRALGDAGERLLVENGSVIIETAQGAYHTAASAVGGIVESVSASKLPRLW